MTSVCPSVCGCLEVERASRVPNSCAKAFQTELVHRGSRSPMSRDGRPKCLITCLNNRLATSRAVMSTVVAMKRVYFVSLSTTTRMASLLRDLGSPVMRSSDISSKGLAGISSGCRNPTPAPQLCLIFWQRLHVRMYLITSVLMPGQ